MPIIRCDQKLIYFAHVPKCGGTSVEHWLKAEFGPLAFLDPKFRRRGQSWTRTSPQHVSASQLSRLFPPGFFDHGFAMVRHPANRVRSAFAFQRNIENSIDKNTTLVEWLVQLQERKGVNHTRRDGHFRTQCSFVPEWCQVFRLEDGFGPLTEWMNRKTGRTISRQVPHALMEREKFGVSPVQLTDEAVALIEEIYQEDYELFGYPRHCVAKRSPLKADALIVPSKMSLRDLGGPIRIKTGAPRGAGWGETAFAEGLASALGRMGAQVEIDPIEDWYQAEAGGAAATICLRGFNAGGKAYFPPNRKSAVMWLLYDDLPKISSEELAAYGHIFVASGVYLPQLHGAARPGVSLLPQAFDADRMAPVDSPACEDIVYVANNPPRFGTRPMASWIAESGVTASVWGKGWRNTEIGRFVRASRLPNEKLGKVYANSLAVLNDHKKAMGAQGFLSNRAFDVLACGRPLISDECAWVPPDMAPFIAQVNGAAELTAALDAIGRETDEMREKRLAFADTMRVVHSFDARARTLVEKLMEMRRAEHTSPASR